VSVRRQPTSRFRSTLVGQVKLDIPFKLSPYQIKCNPKSSQTFP